MSLGPWKFKKISGLMSIEGRKFQRLMEWRSGTTDIQNMSNLFGEFQINSETFVYHPNFMILNMDFNYKPSTRRDRFLIQPNRSEIMTAESGRIQLNVLQNKPIRAQFFSHFSHNFLNRDFISSLETNSFGFGTSLSSTYFNLPTTISFRLNNSDQQETLTNRHFKNNHNKFQAKISKSFSQLDENHLSYTYDLYDRNYMNQWKINNKVNNLELRSNVFLTTKKLSTLHSLLRFYSQTGNNKFSRMLILSNFSAPLPHNFQNQTGLQSIIQKQEGIRFYQNSLYSRFNHQLYLSLNSGIFFDYSQVDHSQYNDRTSKGGVLFQYKKKIPYGLLSLNYQIRGRHHSRKSAPITLRIFNEEHKLSDDQQILLQYSQIDRNSIEIYDATRTFLYQENIDYILIERNSFIEIQRLPGGQIESGATVHVNYNISQPQSYSLNNYDQNFATSVMLFKRFIELYYRFNERDFNQLQIVSNQIFRTFSQYLYGGRLSLGPLTIGAENDRFDSNIIPYRMRRYYVNVTLNLKNRFLLALAGNRRNFWMIQENEKQIFSDISCRVYINLWRNARLDISGGYRYQKGRGLDLELYTGRGELHLKYRFVSLIFGGEIYRRSYHEEINDLDRIFVRLERKF